MPNPDNTKTCEHGNVVCARCVIVTDDARRMSDAINLTTITRAWDELRNGWMAFSLADGTTDYVLYPSKQAAIDHQSNEFRFCYFWFRAALGGAKPKDCQLFLDMHRHIYDAGGRLTDPKQVFMMPLARGQGTWS